MKRLQGLVGRLFAVMISAAMLGCMQTASDTQGTWSGTIFQTGLGLGTVHAIIVQNGDTLSGTWSAEFPSASEDGEGILIGTAKGTAVSATLQPSNLNECPYQLDATVANGTISGTFSGFNCSVATGGNIEMNRTTWLDWIYVEPGNGSHTTIEAANGDILLVGSRKYENDYDCIVTRLGADGALIWQSALGGNGFQSGTSIIELPSGEIIVGFISSPEGLGSPTADIVKFSASGQFTKIATLPTIDSPRIAYRDSNTFVVSTTERRFSDEGEDFSLPTAICLDTVGNQVWKTLLEFREHTRAFEVIRTTDGFVLGSKNPLRLTKLTFDGEFMFDEIIPIDNISTISSLVVNQAGEFLIGGATENSGLIANISPIGVLNWTRTYSGDQGVVGIATQDDGMILANYGPTGGVLRRVDENGLIQASAKLPNVSVGAGIMTANGTSVFVGYQSLEGAKGGFAMRFQFVN